MPGGRGATTSVGVYADFWVSPTGNDSNCGKGYAPFLTPQAAQPAWRALLASGKPASLGIRGGVNFLPSTLQLTSADSGLTIVGHPGETPVLSGGVLIPGAWLPGTGTTSWSASALGGIYQIAFSGTARPRVLWVNNNGTQIRVSRAETSLTTTGWSNTGTGTLDTGFNTGTGTFVTGAGTFSTFVEPSLLEFVWSNKWMQSRCGVTSITGSGNNASVVCIQPAIGNVQTAGVLEQSLSPLPNGIANSFEILSGLNTPGTFFHDYLNGYIYMIPPLGVNLNSSGVSVIAGNLEQLLTATNVSNGTITGVTFSHSTCLQPGSSDGYACTQNGLRQNASGQVVTNYLIPPVAAITISGCNNFQVAKNKIQNLGSVGLLFNQGSSNCEVVGNVISDTSSLGFFGGDTYASNAAAGVGTPVLNNINFHSNVVHDNGLEYQDCGGIWLLFGKQCKINNNIVYNTTYSGISMGVGWGGNPGNSSFYNQMIGNEIRNVLNAVPSYLSSKMFDEGAIYMNSFQTGTLLSGNYIHDVGYSTGGGDQFAIYFDNQTTGVTATNNVAVNVNTPKCCTFANANQTTNSNTFGTFTTNWSGGYYDPHLYDSKATPPLSTPTAGSSGDGIIGVNFLNLPAVVNTADAIAAGLSLNAGLEPAYQYLKSA